MLDAFQLQFGFQVNFFFKKCASGALLSGDHFYCSLVVMNDKTLMTVLHVDTLLLCWNVCNGSALMIPL